MQSLKHAFLAFVVALAAALAPGLAQAKWLRAESPRFVVHGIGDPAGLREYAEKLELYDAVLRKAHGMDPIEAPPRKLDIYLVQTIAGLKAVEPGLSDTTAGFYTAVRGDIFAMAIRDGDPSEVVLHEYAHHFMMQYFPAGYPAWLIEGYAEYYSGAEITKNRISIGLPNATRAGWVLHADWIPMEQLLGGRARQPTPEETASFYAQSWALTHWFLSDPARRKQLQRYLELTGPGGDPVASMAEATGLDMATLQKTVRNYARGQIAYTTYMRAGFVTPPVTVSDLPGSADDLLLPYLAMRQGMPLKDGAALVTGTLRPMAAKHPGDRFAQLALAYGEMWYADVPAAEALLQGLVAKNPRDADALQLLGIIRMNQADKAPQADRARLLGEAQKFLARSHAARGDDYRTLLYYAAARRGEEGYPTENTLNIITLAYDLAPQVSQVRMSYAQMLIRRQKWPEARVALLPVANNPHGGASAAPAKALLAKVEAELAKAPAPAKP